MNAFYLGFRIYALIWLGLAFHAAAGAFLPLSSIVLWISYFLCDVCLYILHVQKIFTSYEWLCDIRCVYTHHLCRLFAVSNAREWAELSFGAHHHVDSRYPLIEGDADRETVKWTASRAYKTQKLEPTNYFLSCAVNIMKQPDI
ncbi:hypothetical protein VQ056_29460 [Paenibacillus sp. JTLBN-2024]